MSLSRFCIDVFINGNIRRHCSVNATHESRNLTESKFIFFKVDAMTEELLTQVIREIHMESSPEPDAWDPPDKMKSLTDECLLRIFSCLDFKAICRSSCVCKRWYVIGKDRSLWRTVNLSPMKQEFNEGDVIKLVKARLHFTRKLNIGNLKVNHRFLRFLEKQCPHLRIFIFGPDSSVQMPSRCLTVFDFPKRIETLDLRHVAGDFDFLIRSNRTYYNIHNIGIGRFLFTQTDLTLLFSKLPNLTIVDLTNCVEFDDNGLKVLATSCPNIESLCLIGCRGIQGKTFHTLLKYCWNLKTLLLRYLKFQDHVLTQNIWRESVIEELDISACPKITWQGLFSFLTQLRHVQYLNMSYCGEGHAVNDAVLWELGNKGVAERLVMLDLRWSFHLTPNALFNFVKRCKNIEYLGLYQSVQVGADNIAVLVGNLPKIKVLEYGGSLPQLLSDSKIIPKLMTYAKQIEVLSLINFTTQSKKDDYKFLKAFMRKSKHLRRINFCDCSPDLVKVGSEAAKKIHRVKVTVKWECALPPPNLTLDSIVL